MPPADDGDAAPGAGVADVHQPDTAVAAARRAIGSGAGERTRLLREMEATPHSGQCNHGRPTYVELQLADIERLFGRR